MGLVLATGRKNDMCQAGRQVQVQVTREAHELVLTESFRLVLSGGCARANRRYRLTPPDRGGDAARMPRPGAPPWYADDSDARVQTARSRSCPERNVSVAGLLAGAQTRVTLGAPTAAAYRIPTRYGYAPLAYSLHVE